MTQFNFNLKYSIININNDTIKLLSLFAVLYHHLLFIFVLIKYNSVIFHIFMKETNEIPAAYVTFTIYPNDLT